MTLMRSPRTTSVSASRAAAGMCSTAPWRSEMTLTRTRRVSRIVGGTDKFGVVAGGALAEGTAGRRDLRGRPVGGAPAGRPQECPAGHRAATLGLMSTIRAVLFDYGHTLVDFRRTE